MQFGETDWEFLLRLASYKGLGILPVHGETLTFGFVNAGIAKNEDMKYTDYEMIREDEQMIYKIYSTQVFNIGESVNIKTPEGENEFMIKSGKTELRHSVFLGEY